MSKAKARPRLGSSVGPRPVVSALVRPSNDSAEQQRSDAADALPSDAPALSRNGTLTQPYAHSDGVARRHTTIAVEVPVDDRLDAFFRREKKRSRRYRTKSDVWNAAMKLFLHQHDSDT